MDGSSFDRIARALGAGVSRRSGLLGALSALGAALPGISGAAAGGKDKGNGNGTGQRGPGIAGPCGPGKKPNVCKQNSDCCTNICKTKIANRDKTGRCRCLKKGRRCSEDRNCCGSISCVAGQCGGKAPMVATGAACGPKDVCRDPNAECTTYQFDTPAGTYCLLPVMGLCSSSSDCTSAKCVGGSCRPCSSPACAESCTPIVCASCTYQTVQAAIDAASDGDVIAIGKGTYVEDLTIASKALTLRACPGDRVTLRNATYGSRTITVTGGSSLTVLDITIDGYQDLANTNFGGGIESDGSLTLAGSTVVKNAGWDTYGAGVRVVGDGLTVTVTDDVAIRGNTVDGNSKGGGGIHVEGESDLLISGWVEITGNDGDSYGGGVSGINGVNATISGHTRITENRATYWGGGVAIYNNTTTRATSVTIKDDVVIADNFCDTYSGGGGILLHGKNGARMTALITDRVQVTGNVSAASTGGIECEDYVDLTISGEVEISGNHADGGGGGLSVASDSSATITGSVRVIDNYSETYRGGGIAVAGQVELTGSAIVSGNTAVKGGGVLLQGIASTLIVSGDATITGNTATDSAPSGGGVWSNDNAHTVTAVTGSITGNTPDQCAGGTISC